MKFNALLPVLLLTLAGSFKTALAAELEVASQEGSLVSADGGSDQSGSVVPFGGEAGEPITVTTTVTMIMSTTTHHHTHYVTSGALIPSQGSEMPHHTDHTEAVMVTEVETEPVTLTVSPSDLSTYTEGGGFETVTPSLMASHSHSEGMVMTESNTGNTTTNHSDGTGTLTIQTITNSSFSYTFADPMFSPESDIATVTMTSEVPADTTTTSTRRTTRSSSGTASPTAPPNSGADIVRMSDFGVLAGAIVIAAMIW